MSRAAGCLICGTPVAEDAPRRADARYCSKPCKDVARLERRRIDRRLYALETWASHCRTLRLPKRQLAAAETEIAQLTARLRVLLGG